VLCTVYLLRKNGERLPREQVRATATVGDVTYDRRAHGSPEYWAWLRDPDTQVTQANLLSAKVMKMRGNGIMIGGWEEQPGGPPVRQAWWCVPRLGG